MAKIDEKMAALQFTTVTQRQPAEVVQLVHDAVAMARGLKYTLDQVGDHRIQGAGKNFARVTLGEFAVSMAPGAAGGTTVTLEITDYTRVRSTMYFIPVGPWEAPAYKSLKDVSEHVRAGL